jgi:hypothetical protein
MHMTEIHVQLIELMKESKVDQIRELLQHIPDILNQEYEVIHATEGLFGGLPDYLNTLAFHPEGVWTLLGFAIYLNNTELMAMLIENGASYEAANQVGNVTNIPGWLLNKLYPYDQEMVDSIMYLLIQPWDIVSTTPLEVSGVVELKIYY